MPRRKIEFRPGSAITSTTAVTTGGTSSSSARTTSSFLGRLREILLGERTPELAPALKRTAPPVADVLCYCLMPNHYHLLVKLRSAEFSSAMQRLTVSYAKAINKRRELIGSLFQGPFQAIHVDCEDYLVYLSRYVHRNPVAAGMVTKAEEWEFSSYREYVGLRAGSLPACELILRSFAGRKAYRSYCERALTSAPQGVERLLLDE